MPDSDAVAVIGGFAADALEDAEKDRAGHASCFYPVAADQPSHKVSKTLGC